MLKSCNVQNLCLLLLLAILGIVIANLVITVQNNENYAGNGVYGNQPPNSSQCVDQDGNPTSYTLEGDDQAACKSCMSNYEGQGKRQWYCGGGGEEGSCQNEYDLSSSCTGPYVDYGDDTSGPSKNIGQCSQPISQCTSY
jgi:hypothetical protein